jgi:hypothetical protein
MTVVLRVIRNDAPIRARRLVRGRAERVFPAIVEPVVEPLETVVAHSIEELGRREWDSLFLNELEDWYYLRALERAQVEHCEPIYFAIRSRGRLVAATPVSRPPRACRAVARAVAALAGAAVLGLASPLPAGSASRRERPRRSSGPRRNAASARDESVLRGLDGTRRGDADASARSVSGGVPAARV